MKHQLSSGDSSIIDLCGEECESGGRSWNKSLVHSHPIISESDVKLDSCSLSGAIFKISEEQRNINAMPIASAFFMVM